MGNWERLSEDAISGSEYTNAEHGWRNTETGAEVIIYLVKGTGMEEITDQKWALQHPADENNEHTHFFNNNDAAVERAKKYIRENPTPTAQY